MIYAGIDVGTSGCKGGLFDENGDKIAAAGRSYSLETPEPGCVELNPKKVFAAVKETIKELGNSGKEIHMLAVSSIGESLVLLDDQDRILMNGMIYLDSRGEDLTASIQDTFGAEQLYRQTGVPLNPMYSLVKLVWIKNNMPHIMEACSKIFMFGDYIGYMLSGERLIDASSASRTMLFDIKDQKWSAEICGKLRISENMLSSVAKTGTIMGNIKKPMADELGVNPNMKIILGCHDQCSALLGAGAVKRGDIIAGEGSTESINLIIGRESIDRNFYKRGLILEPYIEEGQYIIPVGQLSHGSSIRWFLEKVCGKKGQADCYAEAEKNCPEDAGELFFLPFMSKTKSQDIDNKALGVFLGLEIATTQEQMYRALLEGLCFETKKCFDLLLSQNLPMNTIIASGGCSKSKLLMQMKADVLGKKIRLLQSADTGIAGLAMICAKAAGQYNSYAQAAQNFVRLGEEYCPGRDYSIKYYQYSAVREAIKLLYKRADL